MTPEKIPYSIHSKLQFSINASAPKTFGHYISSLSLGEMVRMNSYFPLPSSLNHDNLGPLSQIINNK
jgi:hypothetical protein